MCLARGTVGGERGEWMRGLDLGFTKSVFGLRWCGWCKNAVCHSLCS